MRSGPCEWTYPSAATRRMRHWTLPSVPSRSRDRVDARLGPVSTADPEHLSTADLEGLVGEWLTVPDVAERYDLRLSDVRQMLADRAVVAARIGDRRVVAIPAKFFDEDGPRPEMRGTITVLSDGGMNDEEVITWLHTPDDTLPVEGAPIDAIIGGHKTEVRRRAQEQAF